MLGLPTNVSWTCDHLPTNACGFVIYASKVLGERGEKLAETCRDARFAQVILREGLWYVRVAIKLTNCREQQWPRLVSRQYHVTGREVTPVGPASLGVAHVEPDVHGFLTIDPPPISGGRHHLQVVEVDEADTWPGSGLLVGEHNPEPGGVLRDRGRVSVPVAMDGFSRVPGALVGPLQSKRVVVSPIGPNGKRGDGTTVTAIAREREHLAETVIARVDTVGGTYTGFPAPLKFETHEHNAGDGFRTRLLPTVGNAAAWGHFGSVGGPSAASTLRVSPYPHETPITTNEVDLGADSVFVMECHAAIRRIASAATSLPVHGMTFHPAIPANDVPDIKASELHLYDPLTYGAHYLARDTIAGTGKARNPLKLCRWEVRADTVTPIAAPWQDYVPGMQMRGRYVQARLTLVDETGWHQVKTGELTVAVRWPRRRWETNVAWPGPIGYPGVIVPLPVHPITGGSLFPNAMFAVATGQGLTGAMSVVAVSGQAPGAPAVNVMVWDPAVGGARLAPDVVDLIVTGW